MAQTHTPKTPPTAMYTVLRAICMHGQRVEVGDSVEMTPLQYAEARNAGKVGPLVAAAAPTKAAPAKPARAKATAAADVAADAATDAAAQQTTPEETNNVAI